MTIRGRRRKEETPTCNEARSLQVKNYSKDVIVKADNCSQKKIETDEWNQMGSPEANPILKSHLPFDKVYIAVQRGQGCVSINSSGPIGYLC